MAADREMNSPPGGGQFSATHWSVVVTAGRSDLPEAAAAVEKLCRAYWYPLYAYVRRQGNNPEDAEDLTQQFFCRLIERDYLSKADRDRGKVCNFLLNSMNNFLVNEWKKAGRVKRGGGQILLSLDADEAKERYAGEPIEDCNPASAYDRLWAVALIEQVFSVLRTEYALANQGHVFEALKGLIWGDTDSSYAEIGRASNLTEGAVK